MLENELRRYKPSNPLEEFYKEQMLYLLEYSPDCFDRSCPIGHFTASALILNKTRKKVLLLKHRKLQLWLQPGGHCDGDKNTLRVALREVYEETGLTNCHLLKQDIFDIDMHMIPPFKDQKTHYHFDIRYILHHQGEDNCLQANNESEQLHWFDISERLPTQDRSVLKMIKKAYHESFIDFLYV